MSGPRFLFDAPPSPQGEADLPQPAPATGLFLRLAYGFGALLLLGTLFAAVNPTFGYYSQEATGFDARRWPWQALFGRNGNLAWHPATAWILTLGLSGLALLAAAFLTARMRAVLGLFAAVLLGVELLPFEVRDLPFCGLGVVSALLLAAAVAGNRAPRSPGARNVTLVALIALAGLLFLPLAQGGPEEEEIESADEYRAVGVGTIQLVKGIATSEEPPVGTTKTRLLMALLPQMCWVLSLPVGLLLLLGWGRPWAPWVLGLLVLVQVLGPPAWMAFLMVEEGRSQVLPGEIVTGFDSFALAARGASESVVLLERLLLLPLALGLIDLMRPRRLPG